MALFFSHRQHHRNFALGADAGDLLRIQRQVVAQHPGGFLRCGAAEQRDVVEHAGDVVEQGKQIGGRHGT